MQPKLFVATKAFIEHDGKVLLLRESSHYEDGSNSGSYDIVGGRMEPGQHFQESLLREIKEETGLEVSVGKPFFVNEWRPTVHGESWQIVGIFFECHSDSADIKLSEDHDEALWIDPKDYGKTAIIPGLAEAFEAYLNR